MTPERCIDPTNMLFIILSVALMFFPFGFASIDTSCLPSEEADALNEIGRKLGKDWDFDGEPCCRWASPATPGDRIYENNITCVPNGTIYNVVSISLKGQSLRGILPPELVNLRYLQNIDLTRNYLSGSIPPEWGSMQRILNISLLANRINGSIPKELGNISTLTSLTVEDNMMTGIIPEELGNLTSIERFFLNSNYFTGELPASFANLINMKEFRIGGNNFSGKIPDYIGEWTRLKTLRIQASGLEGPIPSSITLMPTLTDLRISDLRGPDSLCPPFSNMTPFKNLILRSCNLIGNLPPPESLASRGLKILDFSFNKLNGSIPNGYTVFSNTDFIYLTGNLLSGSVPDWMLSIGDNIDLSYNNFTFQSSRDSRCQVRGTNLFASFSNDKISNKVSCLRNSVCSTNSTSLYIDCGGRSLRVGDKQYEADDQEPGRPAGFSSTGSRWGFSNTGNFMDDGTRDSYIAQTTSRLSMNNSELYMTARTSAISLTYYSFCMRNGSYNVSLHFAEIIFTDDTTYSSLGRRVFDIYIQGMLVEKDFDISEKAGGARKAIVQNYTANVTSTLEIRLYWAGKGTLTIPSRGVYGPLISAISVDPDFRVPQSEESSPGNGNGVSGGIVVGVSLINLWGLFCVGLLLSHF